LRERDKVMGEKKPREKLPASLTELLKKFSEVELEDVEIDAEELEIWIQPILQAIPPAPGVAGKAKPTEIMEAEFTPPVIDYPGQIAEVRLGAVKAEGGSRAKVVTIGGEKTPALYQFAEPTPHPPIISGDVFDWAVPLPKAVRMHLEEVIGDPAAWAKLYVEKFGVDMVTLELTSIDPLIKDTPVSEALRVVENVLQAVDVPLVIGGCGAPEKDVKVLPKVAEVAEGERVLLSSATIDIYKPIAEAAEKHGHVVLAWTSLDLLLQKELNRKLLEILPKEQIVIDPTSAALGYGIEYAFTIMERMRLAGLLGDVELQMPIGSGTSNAWGAREAWLKNPELGPREFRGPLWETVSALTFLLAGCDLFFMLHPASIKTTKDIIRWLTRGFGASQSTEIDWTALKV